MRSWHQCHRRHDASTLCVHTANKSCYGQYKSAWCAQSDKWLPESASDGRGLPRVGKVLDESIAGWAAAKATTPAVRNTINAFILLSCRIFDRGACCCNYSMVGRLGSFSVVPNTRAESRGDQCTAGWKAWWSWSATTGAIPENSQYCSIHITWVSPDHEASLMPRWVSCRWTLQTVFSNLSIWLPDIRVLILCTYIATLVVKIVHHVRSCILDHANLAWKLNVSKASWTDKRCNAMGSLGVTSKRSLISGGPGATVQL